MSTKNFVSYGDAESLMSGIKDAIDAGGGGKVTVASYTNQAGTIRNALNHLRGYIDQLTQEQQMFSYIAIYGGLYGQGDIVIPWSVGKMTNYYDYGKLMIIGTDITSYYASAHIHKTNNTSIYLYFSGTDISGEKLSSKNITKIELGYFN